MQFQYNIKGTVVYSRSSYGALMYARSLFRECLYVHDVLDGETDAELNYEDRPITIMNNWSEITNKPIKCANPRYWNHETRQLEDSVPKGLFYYAGTRPFRGGGCC